METKKIKSKLSSIAVMSAIGLVITAGGCTTSKQNCKNMKNSANKDSYLAINNTKIQKELTDSIANIIFNAEKIKIDRIKYSGDSIQSQQCRAITKDEIKILKYLLTDGRNYSSNIAVYGLYRPQLRLTVQDKKQELTLYFDCSLKKWSVCDKDDKEIKRYDLETNELHRYFCTLMPEDEFLNGLFKTLYQQEEEKK